MKDNQSCQLAFLKTKTILPSHTSRATWAEE